MALSSPYWYDRALGRWRKGGAFAKTPPPSKLRRDTAGNLIDGRGKEFVAFSVGYSILNRTATVDVGSLMLKNGGGGHKKVGTCQVPYDKADGVLQELIQACK